MVTDKVGIAIVGRGSRAFCHVHNAEDDFQSIAEQRRTARRAVGPATCHHPSRRGVEDSDVSFTSRGANLALSHGSAD
jgi:hypothetical protein